MTYPLDARARIRRAIGYDTYRPRPHGLSRPRILAVILVVVILAILAVAKAMADGNSSVCPR